MIAYTVYGLLFIAGLITLGLLTLDKSAEGGRQGQRPSGLLRAVLLLGVLFILLQSVPALLHVRMGLVVSVFDVLLVSLVFFSVFLAARAQIRDAAGRRRKQESMMRRLVEEAKAAPDDAEARVRLASAFENLGMYSEATEEYNGAWKLCKDKVPLYAAKLKEMENAMSRLACSAGEVRTVICPACEARARPEQRRCLRCGALLYASELQLVWRNISLPLKIAGIAVVAGSLVYVTWVPITYSLTLMGIWLAVVLRVSLRSGKALFAKALNGG